MYARYRTRDSALVTATAHKGSSASTVSTGTVKTYRKDEMWDNKTPKYFRLKKDPKVPFLPVQPMKQVSTRGVFLCNLDVTYGIYTTNQKSHYSGLIVTAAPLMANKPEVGSAQWIQSWSRTGTPSLPDIDQLESWLMMEAIARARDQAWDVLTFALEFRKTLELFTKFGYRIDQRRKRIEEIIRKDKLRRYGDPERLSGEKLVHYQRTFLEMWMEYRYGWRILYYDMLAATRAAEQMLGKAKLLRSTSKETTSRTSTGTSTSRGITFYSEGKLKTSYTSLDFRWNHFNVQTVESRVGIGMVGEVNSPVYHDLLVTGWELTRFSFVIDRFIQIGDTLRSVLPLLRGDVGYAWASRKSTSELRTDVSSYEFTPYYQPGGTLPSRVDNMNSTVRSIVETTTRRKLNLELSIGRRIKLDPAFLLDAVALLAGNSRHLRRGG